MKRLNNKTIEDLQSKYNKKYDFLIRKYSHLKTFEIIAIHKMNRYTRFPECRFSDEEGFMLDKIERAEVSLFENLIYNLDRVWLKKTQILKAADHFFHYLENGLLTGEASDTIIFELDHNQSIKLKFANFQF